MNTGLWFVWSCACLFGSAPKSCYLRTLRRHINPALTKSHPKTFPQYMRRAVSRVTISAASLMWFRDCKLGYLDSVGDDIYALTARSMGLARCRLLVLLALPPCGCDLASCAGNRSPVGFYSAGTVGVCRWLALLNNYANFGG